MKQYRVRFRSFDIIWIRAEGFFRKEICVMEVPREYFVFTLQGYELVKIPVNDVKQITLQPILLEEKELYHVD